MTGKNESKDGQPRCRVFTIARDSFCAATSNLTSAHSRAKECLKGVYCCTAASSIAIFSQITFFRSSSHNQFKCDGVAAWHIAESTCHPQPPRVSLRSSMSTTRESVRRTSFAGAWTLARIKAAEGCGVVVVEAENPWRSRYFASDPRHRYPRPAIEAETWGLALHARPSSSSRRGFQQFACP